jgi:plasmid stabilization system protein ParE
MVSQRKKYLRTIRAAIEQIAKIPSTTPPEKMEVLVAKAWEQSEQMSEIMNQGRWIRASRKRFKKIKLRFDIVGRGLRKQWINSKKHEQALVLAMLAKKRQPTTPTRTIVKYDDRLERQMSRHLLKSADRMDLAARVPVDRQAARELEKFREER